MTPGLAVNLPQVGARILRRLSPSLVGFIKAQRLFISRDSFLKITGYLHSCAEGHPCEPDGSPLPWMNYALIRFLQQRLNPSLTLFEYGSGYSTLFFARLVDQVVSVEADRDWFEDLRPKCPPNVTLVYQPFEPDATYCQLVSRDGPQHDIVVIDGSDRMRCAAHASDGLRAGGVIILDDMQRDANLEAANHLHQTGFRRIDFEGPKPGGVSFEQASVFYKTQNCLGI